MQPFTAQLEVKHPCDSAALTAPADMPLHQLAAEYDLETVSYFLIRDDRQRLIGVVSAAEVLKRIGSWHEVERTRWSDMPVEALMKCRLDLGARFEEPTAAPPGAPTLPHACTALTQSGKLFALQTEDDLLVSWRHVETALQNALVDTVTSLPNRAVFERRFHEEFFRSKRLRQSIAVILLDVDHFKQVNDVHGHAAGDSLLERVGACMRRNMRSYDLVARYGGDEFAVLCSGCRPAEIKIPIRRLKLDLERIPLCDAPDSRNLSVSIGAAVLHNPLSLEHPESLIEEADRCLYFAKRNGRGRAYQVELGLARQTAAEPQLVEQTA